MNILPITLNIIAQLLAAWLLLYWFAREPKKVAALAVASQRKRAR